MDEKRAKTLEALSTYVDAQKALLQRTQTDIARLKQLRDDIASTSEDSCDFHTFGNEIASSKLSEREDIVATLPIGLDWSVFASRDPTPLRTLATNVRLANRQRNEPSPKQQSPLSGLQQLVKTARVSIVDPILDAFAPLSSDEEDDPPDPEELRRIREREKIRELKRRRIHGGSTFFKMSGLGLVKTGADAVFVREDLEDESADVDIGQDAHTTATTPSSSREVKMEIDTPATSVASPPPLLQTALPSPLERDTKSSRVRRPSQKAEQQTHAVKPSSSKKKPEQPIDDDSSKVDKRGKLRPETYKQAWSVSEQHLLERLLEEIPEGEKNRWAKISKAMNGKRTARQVASRVQKYYEKLKRYGLDVGTSGTTNNES